MRHKTKFGQLTQSLQARSQHHALQAEKLAQQVAVMRVADALEDPPQSSVWDVDLQFGQAPRDRWGRMLASQVGKPAFDFNKVKIKIVPGTDYASAKATERMTAWQKELMDGILGSKTFVSQKTQSPSAVSIKLLAEQRALEKRQAAEFLEALAAMRVAEALEPPIKQQWQDDVLDAMAPDHFRHYYASFAKAILPDAQVVHTTCV